MVGQESGASCEVGSSISSKPPVSSKFSYESAVDMRLLRKLQELKEEYTSALEAAKERSDALRIKRYSYIKLFILFQMFIHQQ